MDKLREERIIELARLWFMRLPRTYAEISAYMNGTENALIAAYEDTPRGMSVSHEIGEALERMFSE